MWEMRDGRLAKPANRSSIVNEGEVRAMATSWYEIPVPGRWDPEVALIDLETAKVPTGGFVMKNGEPLRNRWSVVFAGVANLGWVFLIDGDDEPGILDGIAATLAGASQARYAATREFDEMVCRGRFTNARRAHEDFPFFPAVPGADLMSWRNVLPAYR